MAFGWYVRVEDGDDEDDEEYEDDLVEWMGSLRILADIFKKIYDACDNSKVIKIEKDIYEAFKSYPRDILRFRQDDLFEEARLEYQVNIRLAGICCLLREAVEKENGSDFKLVIQREESCAR